MEEMHDEELNDAYDSPWKKILDYLPQFLAFFFPNIHAAIDWTVAWEPLSGELHKTLRKGLHGDRHVDKVFKVRFKSGKDVYILLHIEVQCQKDKTFAERIFLYGLRLFDLYKLPVLSMAVLADDRKKWKPDRYDGGFPELGHEFVLKFPVVKLLDWVGKEDVLEADGNIFSLVVLAHLKSLETKGNDQARAEAKMHLIRLLFRHGYSRQEMADLLIFIDWVLTLPDKIDRGFWEEVSALKEVQTMQYMPSFMREKYEEGREDGREEGEITAMATLLLELLKEKFNAIPDWAIKKIEGAKAETLNQWAINIVKKGTIDEVLS